MNVNTIYIHAQTSYVNTMNIEQDMTLELARLRKIAWRMDALFTIPKTRITVGLDNILGLVPVVGDLLALGPSLWLIHKAYRLGATPGALAYMILNTTLDVQGTRRIDAALA